MLTGGLQFKEKTAVDIVVKHMNEKVPSICHIRSDLPPEMDQFMQKAMAKSPEDRYSTPQEFISAIEQLQQHIQTLYPERREPIEDNPVAEIGYNQKQGQATREAQPVTAQVIREPGRQKTKATAGFAMPSSAPQKQARFYVLANNQSIPLTGDLMFFGVRTRLAAMFQRKTSTDRT